MSGVKRPFWKRPGIMLIIMVGLVVGVGAVGFVVDEGVLQKRVVARDFSSGPVCWLLGLRGVKKDETRDALVAILDTRSSDKPAPSDLRRAAAYALGSLKGTKHVPPLIESAKNDPDPLARAQAVKALGKCGDRLACDGIEPAIDDPDPKVRRAAAEALESLDIVDWQVLGKLVKHAGDPDYGARRAVLSCLIFYAKEDYGTEPADWGKWYEKNRK